jgi:hypothetical protein
VKKVKRGEATTNQEQVKSDRTKKSDMDVKGEQNDCFNGGRERERESANESRECLQIDRTRLTVTSGRAQMNGEQLTTIKVKA